MPTTKNTATTIYLLFVDITKKPIISATYLLGGVIRWHNFGSLPWLVTYFGACCVDAHRNGRQTDNPTLYFTERTTILYAGFSSHPNDHATALPVSNRTGNEQQIDMYLILLRTAHHGTATPHTLLMPRFSSHRQLCTRPRIIGDQE